MLEKNKDYIELKAACCSYDYCQGYMTHLDITGYSNSDLATPLPNPGTDYILISKEKFDRLQANVGINAELAKQWEINYNLLLKKIGFDTVEELVDYLVNEAECDTLHEAISKLHDEVGYIGDELASANSENNSWKATAECNSPKTLRTKLTLLRGNIEEWKEATGCPNPSSAKTAIESGASWCLAYNKVKKKYDQSIEIIGEWQRATGHFLPKASDEELASLKKEVSDYKEQIKSLYKVIESWKEVTGCSTPEEAKDWVNELGEANGNLAQAVLSWQNVTGCSCPKDLSKKIVEWEKVFTPRMSARDLSSAMSNAIESYKHKFAPWEEITGFSTPEKCSSYIDILEKKLEDIKNLIEED